jgi:hypothetical protein
MQVVNRTLIIIKPKTPYLEWANRTAQSYETLDELRKSSRAVLVSSNAFRDKEKYLEENYGRLFELELDAWVSERKLWPKQIDFQVFNQWFDVEFYALVIDSLETDLLKEPYT